VLTVRIGRPVISARRNATAIGSALPPVFTLKPIRSLYR